VVSGSCSSRLSRWSAVPLVAGDAASSSRKCGKAHRARNTARAARYATVLADDPGCSVLSFTSVGMSQLSRPQAGPSRSRVVAMWKDAFSSANEIELPLGYDAVAISLSIRYRKEYTADGRCDDGFAAFPILSGVHPIRVTNRNKVI
jgi:hypothetical protein